MNTVTSLMEDCGNANGICGDLQRMNYIATDQKGSKKYPSSSLQKISSSSSQNTTTSEINIERNFGSAFHFGSDFCNVGPARSSAGGQHNTTTIFLSVYVPRQMRTPGAVGIEGISRAICANF